MFGGGGVTVPIPERPIPIRENFRRAAKRDKPVWLPNSATDIDAVMVANLTGWGECDWSRTDRYDWVDQFGCIWTYVPEAGGPMLKIGTKSLEDICDWKRDVKFPNLADYKIAELCAEYAKTHDPERVLQVNVGLGCTERMVALLGGYEEAMCAMALEPDAVSGFLEAFVDAEIEVVSKLCEYLPIDLITYHDDWGTERDTFFGEAMMENIVYNPTKRLFDFFRSKDIIIEHHCCGNIKRFVPYQVKLGVDFLQIQDRANDIPAFKRNFGSGIGFERVLAPLKAEDVSREVCELVDVYGKGGGAFASLTAVDPEVVWNTTFELNNYSQEYYSL
jgi:hypothetical protein